MLQYEVNGQVYQFAPDRLDEFLSKFPNAQPLEKQEGAAVMDATAGPITPSVGSMGSASVNTSLGSPSSPSNVKTFSGFDDIDISEEQAKDEVGFLEGASRLYENRPTRWKQIASQMTEGLGSYIEFMAGEQAADFFLSAFDKDHDIDGRKTGLRDAETGEIVTFNREAYKRDGHDAVENKKYYELVRKMQNTPRYAEGERGLQKNFMPAEQVFINDDGSAETVRSNYAKAMADRHKKSLELTAKMSKNKITDSKGFLDAVKNGRVGDVILESANFIQDSGEQLIAGWLTGGISMAAQMGGMSYHDYNLEKAKSIYGEDDPEAFQKLIASGQDELATPAAFATLGYALERAGYKGLTKEIMKRSFKGKKAFSLFVTGNKEGLTEYGQGLSERMNKNIGKGMSFEDAIKDVGSYMTTEEAWDQYFAGLIGGTAVSAGGSKINAALRNDESGSAFINERINRIAAYADAKARSTSKRRKKKYEDLIQIEETELKEYLESNKDLSNYLSKNQEDGLNNLVDNLRNTRKEIKDLKSLYKKGVITKEQFDAGMEAFNEKMSRYNKGITTIKNDANMSKLQQDLDASGQLVSAMKGLEQEVYKTEEDFLAALKAEILAQGGTEQDFINATQDKSGRKYTIDGLKVGGKLLVNAQVAAERNATATGTHEVLHGLLKSTLQEDDGSGNLSKEGEKIVKDFLSTLTRSQRKRLDKKLDAGKYRKNEDGSDKEFKEYGEEYINFYAQLSKQEQLDLSKVGQFFSKFFNKNTEFKKISFETGADTKAFLDAIVADSKEGIYRKEIMEFAEQQDLTGDKTVKPSMTAEQRATAQSEVQRLGQEGLVGDNFRQKGLGKLLFDASFDDIYNKIKSEGYLDNLIASKFKGESVPKDFVDKVYSELTSHAKNFNPEQNDDFFGYLNSQIANKAGNVYNREYKVDQTAAGRARDIGETTQEGEVKVQVAAETDAELEALETEDLSVAGQMRKRTETAEKTSKLRKMLGFETGGDMYTKLLDATKKSLVLAYRKTLNIKDATQRAKAIKNMLHDEYFSKGLTSDAFKPLKNFLGTKDYIKNLKEYREAIFGPSGISVADLVQMERKVPENQRIFTTFVRQLTSKQDVQDAVRKDLLPPDALNKIDKGQAVNLYKRRIPTEAELVDYADQPAINPETGARSGLKGTRKDGIAKAMAVSLVKDATMQARKSEEVSERIDESDNYQAEIQELASAIGRDATIMFSREQVVDGLADNTLDILENLASDKVTIGDIVEVIYEKGKKPKYKLKVPIYHRKKDKTVGKREHSNEDKAIAARIIYDFHNAYGKENYGDTKDPKLKLDLVKRIVKSSRAGKRINIGMALEDSIRTTVESFLKGTGLESLRGKGDVYLGLGNLLVGVESKLDKARGVSQTIAAFLSGKLDFSNKNDIRNEDGDLFDDIIGDQLKEVYSQIKQDLENAGMPLTKDALSNEQVKFLRDNKHKYGTSIEVDLDYLTWHYAHGKYANMPQGFIQVGQQFYRMETGNENVDNLSAAIASKLGVQTLDAEGNKIQLVARLPMAGNSIKFRMSPRIDGSKFKKSDFNLLNKSQAKKFAQAVGQELQSQVKIQNSRTLKQAVKFSREQRPSRGMSTFDFDETLIIDGENFVTATKDGETVRIPSDKWPIDGPIYADKGWEFDFSDFVNVRGGKEGPLLQKMKNQIKKYGPDNVFVLTARMQEAAQPIHEWLKTQGINIPFENITGLGNSKGEAKALWMLEKYAEGYNDMYFVDDALPNVEAVQNIFDQLDVKGKSVQAKVQFSRSLDQEFNSILETVTGIEAEKRFSDIKARKRGADKGKFRFFIPPSHEDFVGLIYNFLGKGAEGNRHRDFFEAALIRPLNRAYRELDAAKQSIANDFKALNKNYKDIKNKLKKKTADGDFTFEDAIRVYIWTKNGYDIPGLSKKDQDMLNEYVNLDPVLKVYANAVEIISRVDGYIPPTESWDAGDIRSDLLDATGKVGRGQYFTEFVENANEIFSNKNLNKIEAAYGRSVRESIEDMLYSIRTGERRPQGQNKIVNAFVNFINGAVGTVMFFNMRSSLLQQMSIVNYMNFAENNLLAMAKAFANQKQYWKDWAYIFNSDMMKQRRGGIQTDVNGAELVQTVSNSRFPMRMVIKKLLALGFTPTQIGDSIAISTGGATYYRNRINKYVKEGLTQKQAEEAAWNDFNELTQSTQQSAREDMISAQQRSAVGKFILSFQNVTSQFNRLGKKAFLDLKNRRITKPNETQLQSDISNIARLTYYIGIQNMVFYALQTALFMAMLDDDEEETEKEIKSRNRKYEYAVNGAIDSVLRGTGIYGAIVATVKNVAIAWTKERGKTYNKDESATLRAALDVSPPLGIKARKIVNAEKTLNYNKDVIEHMELSDIDNPIWPAVTSYFEVVNLPLNKVYNKVQNVRQAFNKDHEAMERIMMFFGWSQYNLDIENEKMENIKSQVKEQKQKDSRKKRKKKSKFKGL
jgi:hypothetical protein